MDKSTWSGQISVFLSLILICVCSLICALLESARTSGARCFLQTAVHSSMDSLFSQYHRGLWEQYRIFGLEHLKEEDAAQEFSQFLGAYLDQENWYPFQLEQCEVEDRKVLTEDSGEYFQREILDYMKYGIWTKEWSADSAGEMVKDLTEATQISDLTRSMEIQTKDAWKLEKSLEKLAACLKEQNRRKDQAAARLDAEDGSGFCSQGEGLIRKLEETPGLIASYEKQADELGRTLEQLKEKYQEKSPDFSGGVQEFYQSELSEYEAYTDKDGERRRQITGLSEAAEGRITLVRSVMEEAEAVEEYIANWEPEEKGDELDTSALWAPVQAHFAQYEPLSLPFEAGVKDKEKEGLLKRLREMADQGILSLVLPKGGLVSEKRMDIHNSPSHRIAYTEGGVGILEHAIIAEYGQVFFHHFCDGGEQGLAYEMEYLLFGRESDKENLVQTVELLLAVREGMNLLHIMRDSEKRSQAEALAVSVTGTLGLVPLITITKFLIMGVWAFGEAAADIKTLLKGGRIPVIKDKEDWTLSLEQLMDFASSGVLEDAKTREKGLNYQQYLTVFLLTRPGTQLLYRMMDVIEWNLAEEQRGFQLSDCAYRVDIRSRLCGKHVYFSLGMLKSVIGGDGVTYSVEAEASKAY